MVMPRARERERERERERDGERERDRESMRERERDEVETVRACLCEFVLEPERGSVFSVYCVLALFFVWRSVASGAGGRL